MLLTMTTIDVEAESEALRRRSTDLAELLDAGHPVLGPQPPEVDESRRLGHVANVARQQVGARVAAGKDPGEGVTVGAAPQIRRVRTDRWGNDLDPMHGRTTITPQLVAYWEHRRDVVAVAVEGRFRQALEQNPYRPALVAAVQGHLAMLRQRRSTGEGLDVLDGALRRYDQAYANLRESALDAQHIATEAEDRLASLRREAAKLEVGDVTQTGLIASVLAVDDPAPVDHRRERLERVVQ
jgi:hypothetical protein